MSYSNPDKQRAFQRGWQRRNREKRRLKVVELLGGKCRRCGYKENVAALQIDHIEPELRKHIHDKWSGQRTVNLISRGLITLKGLQLLCANCHAIKTYEEDRLKFGRFNAEIHTPAMTKVQYYDRNK